MPAQGEAISSVSENSRNPGFQVKTGTKNPNGVALTFGGLTFDAKCSVARCCQWCGRALWL